jgi:4-carboxymuconolactone decarboxylase
MRRHVLVVVALAASTVGLMAQRAGDPAAARRAVEGLRGDRFAPLTWEQLTPEQKTMVNDLLAGSRTSLGGPFNVYLRSPELGNIAQSLGEYVRFHSTVPRKLNEMAILMTAKWWSSQYEWVAHKPLAMQAGLSEAVIDDLQAGRRPTSLQPDEAIVYDFSTEMRETRRVSDKTFAAAKSLLGEQGVMDLIGLMGYYDLVSMSLNTDRYPLPDGAAAPFPEP